MQRVEIGDAVDAEHDRFAVDNELLVFVLQRRLDDPRIALAPVITAARDQPHAIAVALDPQAVAVILDLVEPIRTAGDLDAASGNAELKRLKHSPEIGAPDGRLRVGQCLRSSSAPLGKDTEASAHHPPKTEAVSLNTLRWRAFKITNPDRHRKRQLDRFAGIMTLQKVEEKVWHRSARGAALPQFVGGSCRCHERLKNLK